MVNVNNDSCYTGDDFIPDTRIRFIANKIYIRNNYWWNNNCKGEYVNGVCPTTSLWRLYDLDQQIVNNPSIPRGINIYFTEDSFNYRHLIDLQDLQDPAIFYGNSAACSQLPSYTDYNRTSKVHELDIYSKYWWFQNLYAPANGVPWDRQRKAYANLIGRGLAHEIGHSLSLEHVCNFYGSNECRVAVMSPAGSSPRNYIPPPEIGKIYACFSLSNLRSFIPDNTFLGVKTITTNYDMPYNMRLYHSLNIANTASLTISEDIVMSSEGQIEVYGKLIINDANLTSIGEKWKGITVKNNGYLEITSSNISK